MKLIDFIGSTSTSLRNRIVDQVWERRMGIQTCGNLAVHEPDCHLYGTFAYRSIMRILGNLNWRPDDVFVDIGCGKGRVVCCAAQFGARKVIGIDLDERLCNKARANAEAMRGRHSPIEIVHMKAQEFDYRECTKFFLFHPFGAATLTQVLERIQTSLETNPRPIDLVYLNPVHEDVLIGECGLRSQARWRRQTWGGLKHDVAFWSNRPRAAANRIEHRPSIYVSVLYGLESCVNVGNEGLLALGAI